MADIEALKEGRRVVDESPDDERFDMRFVDGPPKGCGTAHCAWGYIRSDPWFVANRNTGPKGFPHNWAKPFGITWEQANILFAEVNRQGAEIKAEVIANFDRLIAGEDLVRYDDPDLDEYDDNDLLDDLDDEDDDLADVAVTDDEDGLD